MILYVLNPSISYVSDIASAYDVSDGLEITDCEAALSEPNPHSDTQILTVPNPPVNAILASSCTVASSMSCA